ncbi:MAG: PepSY domain-containing protein, partial [Bacillota bacterium]|nr:PepSY domain-containing protein [Bacillota bacterium]
MTEKNIEEQLARAVKDTTPDILDELMAELNISEEKVPSLRDAVAADAPAAGRSYRQKPKRWKKTLASCAAALMLVIGGVAFFNGQNQDAFAVVGLDVNPSIEISIDKKEKVIAANSINDDGENILADMDLVGTDVDVACNAIVGSMLTQGYLTDTSNALLVSVSSVDDNKGHEIEKRLSDNLNTYLDNTEIAAAILGQYVENDDEIKAFAKENGISAGKAWLIHNLMQNGQGRYTEQSLLQLPTHELILLGQNKDIASDVSYGEVDTSGYIGADKAEDIALAKAGLSRDQVTGLHAEYDCDDGVIIYEVEFNYGGQEYDYEVKAANGEILSYESD